MRRGRALRILRRVRATAERARRVDGLGLAIVMSMSVLASCRQPAAQVEPDPQTAPHVAPIVAPAPYWPPGPPEGTPVTEIGSWSRLGFLIGYRQYPSSWDPFRDQESLRLTGTHEWRDAIVGVEWSAGYAGQGRDVDGVRMLNQNFELSVGPTKTFHLGGARWFANLGAGLAWTYTEEGENTGIIGVTGEHDGWFAGYGHASLIYRVLPAWDIALDVRALKGEDPELGGTTLEGQYWQLSLGFGVGL